MTTDIYSGDPRIVLTKNGSKLVFKGGQPVMDQGLENMALISLFTSPGWAGNVLFPDINQQIGSDFLSSFDQPITLTSLNDISQAAKRALNNPAFGNVSVNVSNPESYRIDVTIIIEPPGQDVQALRLTKNGLNWVAQRLDPASGRI